MKKIMALVMTMALTGAIFAGLSDVTVQGTAPRERACPHNKQELTAAAAEITEETVPVEQTNEIIEDAVEAAPVEDVVVEEVALDETEVVEGAPLAEDIEVEQEPVNVETVDLYTPYDGFTYPCVWENGDFIYCRSPNGNVCGRLRSDGRITAVLEESPMEEVIPLEDVLEAARGKIERNHWVIRGTIYRTLSSEEYDAVKSFRGTITTVDPNYVINNAKYDKNGNFVSDTRSPNNWK